MKRRQFMRLAGGGVVAAATAATLGGCSLGTAYPPEAVQAWAGPGAETEPRRRALAYALTAPNPHNRQPWLADLREPGAITLRLDRDRLLPETDPFGRQIVIGQGAFLELLVMALAEQGLRAEVALWPQGELPMALKDWDTRPVARVQLAAGGVRDPLFAQVLRRHTPKVDYDVERPVAEATVRQLLDAIGRPGVRAGGTVESGRLPDLRRLCWESAQVELLTPRTVMESIRLTRVGPQEILRHRDGITVNGAMPRVADALGLFDRTAPPAKGSTAYDQMMGRFEGHSRTAMGFVWLATPGNSRSQQVEAGRAHVRMQLRATELGLGLHPMSQALQEFPEMGPHYTKAHALLLGKPAPKTAADETVQMFSRIGYTTGEIAATPRRPLRDLLVG